jgi:hypothetical protein
MKMENREAKKNPPLEKGEGLLSYHGIAVILNPPFYCIALILTSIPELAASSNCFSSSIGVWL